MLGALLVTAGRLADDRGRKRLFLTGLTVFAVASALCGLAPSVPLLVAARAVQGVGAFALAAVLLPVLVVRALHHPDPVLPVRLFGVRTFSVATAGTLLFGAALFAMILANVLFMTSVWDYSVLRTAVAVVPSPLLAAVTAPLAGRLADRYGFRVVVLPGAVAMVLAQLWFLTRTTLEPSWLLDFLPGSVLAGLAIGLAFSALGAAGAQALPPQAFGVGSAVGATARQLGAVLGVAVLVAVLGEPAPGELLASFHDAWLAIAVAATACAVVSLGLGRPRVPTA